MPGFHFSLDFLHRSEYQQNRCVEVKERKGIKHFVLKKLYRSLLVVLKHFIPQCPLYNGIP